MGFSGIGIWEIILIIVVILLVLGPHRLPEIGRTLGRAFRNIKKASSDISTNISKELEETKNQLSSPSTKPTSADKPSPVDKPDLPDKDDRPKRTGGTSAEK